MKTIATVAFWLSLVVIANSTWLCYAAGLQVGYYNGKCPNNTDAEKIVKDSMKSQFLKDFTIVPQMIRLQFHDCFVRGCDASILLDGTGTEKSATPSLTLKGFNVIDTIKSAVEKQCPGVVSCADIIMMAAREAVVLGGGQFFNVTTGRRDGLASFVSEALNLIPPADISVNDSIAMFETLGFDIPEMVTLLGSHTSGFTHCSAFQDRLYNYQNTGKADPSMNGVLLTTLRTICPKNSGTDNIVNLDQNTLSIITVDNSFFKQIERKKGILAIDQQIDLDIRTKPTVQMLAKDNSLFNEQFAAAVVKMGALNVLLDPLGEIRASCRSTNSPPP